MRMGPGRAFSEYYRALKQSDQFRSAKVGEWMNNGKRSVETICHATPRNLKATPTGRFVIMDYPNSLARNVKPEDLFDSKYGSLLTQSLPDASGKTSQANRR